MKKIIVFGSGNGSNFQAIIDYFKDKEIEFICISDKENAYILERAKKSGLKSHYIPFSKTYDFLKSQEFDMIVLAGYMRILPKEILSLGTFINIHPSLLPKYKGKDVIQRAYEAREKVTGVTVHYVNEEVDSGEIIAQMPVAIEEKMTIQDLEQEIHNIEHYLYPKVLDNLLFNTPLNIELVSI